MKKGADLHHEIIVRSWDEVKQDSVEFVFLKSTEGVTVVDRMFDVRVAAARFRQIDPKAYHFLHPEDTGLDQANNCLAAIAGKEIVEVAVDLEWVELEGVEQWAKLPELVRYKVIRDFIYQIERAGYTVVVYTSLEFIKEFLPNADFLGKYKLWLCQECETVDELKIPSFWSNATYWQKGPGSIQGIDEPVDVDYQLEN